MRANKSDLGSTPSANNSSIQIKAVVCSTPSKNQSQNASPASANSTVNPSGTVTTVASVITSLSSGILSQNQSLSSSTRDDSYSHTNKSNLARDQQTIQNSIIPTTAPAPFAAVAKHNTLQHTANEGRTNWKILPLILLIFYKIKISGQLYSAFASTAISTATSHANQTASHQSSSVIGSSQQQVNPLKTLYEPVRFLLLIIINFFFSPVVRMELSDRACRITIQAVIV